MSRIAKKPIKIKEGVKIFADGQKVVISGPKGELSYVLPSFLLLRVAGDEAFLERKEETKRARSGHGLFYRLFLGAVTGVSDGWEKTLELVGTGYRARLDGKNMILSVGFSHPVVVSPPEGISFSVEENRIRVSGADKQLVGQTASNIRRVRPPEPYKGKGIRLLGEVVRRKAGKAAKLGAQAG